MRPGDIVVANARARFDEATMWRGDLPDGKGLPWEPAGAALVIAYDDRGQRALIAHGGNVGWAYAGALVVGP